MEIILKDKAKSDMIFWNKSGNKQVLNKINNLLKDILIHPETGIGKPEKLKYELSNFWSRRINDEHRVIYKVVNDELHIISLRGHY